MLLRDMKKKFKDFCFKIISSKKRRILENRINGNFK